MNRRLRRLRDERGTMIPMYVLFMMIIMAIVTIVLDSTQVYLQRRALQGVADGASLAAADGIDESSLYRDGLDQDQVDLVRGQAATAVDDYEEMVNENRSAAQAVDCRVGDVPGNRVQVLCSGTAVLPIVNYISQGAGLGASVEVTTDSWADATIIG